jgi:hypothetical protein
MMDSRESNEFIYDMYYAEIEGQTILKQEVLGKAASSKEQ